MKVFYRMALPPKPQAFTRALSVTLSGGEYPHAVELEQLSKNFDHLVDRVRALETSATVASVKNKSGRVAGCIGAACETKCPACGIVSLAAQEAAEGCVGEKCLRNTKRNLYNFRRFSRMFTTGQPKNTPHYPRKSRKSRKSRKTRKL